MYVRYGFLYLILIRMNKRVKPLLQYSYILYFCVQGLLCSTDRQPGGDQEAIRRPASQKADVSIQSCLYARNKYILNNAVLLTSQFISLIERKPQYDMQQYK
jgi:hypothetical protein